MADSTTLRDYERLADLLSASKERIQAQNPYLAAARAFQPYVPPSGQHTLTTGLAAGLGGIAQGLLGAYGAKKAGQETADTQRRTFEYINKGDLAGMASDPDPYVQQMAAALALSQREKDQESAQESKKMEQAAVYDLLKQGIKYDQETGLAQEIPGYGDILAGRKRVENINPADVEDKAYARLAGTAPFKMLQDSSANYSALKQLALQDTPQADVGFISSIARIWDPNSVVREGEFKINFDMGATPLQKYQGIIQNAIFQKGRLTPEVKKGMLLAAQTKMNEIKAGYNQAAELEGTKILQRGGDPQMAFPIPPQPLEGPEAIEQIFSAPAGARGAGVRSDMPAPQANETPEQYLLRVKSTRQPAPMMMPTPTATPRPY